MVKMQDDVPEPIKQLGAKLKGFLSSTDEVNEEQAEAVRQRFEKAVFHGRYSVDEFEAALDEHRHKMRELGEAIDDLLNQFRKEWKRAKKRNEHRGYASKAIAKTYFKRILALEERIDAHLKKFEQKLSVLTAWRQYKIENDIGSKVDVNEVQRWMADEFDQFELQEQDFDVEEGEELGGIIRDGNGGAIISDEEEQMLDEFVEQQFDDTEVSSDAEEATDEELLEHTETGGGTASGNSDSPDSSGDEADTDIDDELEQFVDKEFN